MLHPQLRDIFVEGRDDARFFRHHLGSVLDAPMRVVAISDAVDVPDALLVSRGLDRGQRSRLLVLSEFVESWNMRQPVATCVVDADFDVIEGALPARECLLPTDYASIEVYGLLPRPFAKFLSLVGAESRAADQIVGTLSGLWRTLFALRFVLHNQHGQHLHDGYLRRCTKGASRVAVDIDEVTRISLQGYAMSVRQAVVESVAAAQGDLETDSLIGIRGHDIAPVLVWFLDLRGDYRHDAVVEKLLIASIESEDLRDQGLFIALTRRLGLAAVLPGRGGS